MTSPLPECDLYLFVRVCPILIKQQQKIRQVASNAESKFLCSFLSVAQHICSFMPRSLLRLLLAAVFVAPSSPYVTAQLDRGRAPSAARPHAGGTFAGKRQQRHAAP